MEAEEHLGGHGQVLARCQAQPEVVLLIDDPILLDGVQVGDFAKDWLFVYGSVPRCSVDSPPMRAPEAADKE